MNALWAILGMYTVVVAGIVGRCAWYGYMTAYVWDSTPDYTKYEEFSEYVTKAAEKDGNE